MDGVKFGGCPSTFQSALLCLSQIEENPYWMITSWMARLWLERNGYLGVTIDNKLTFRHQIDEKCASARKVLIYILLQAQSSRRHSFYMELTRGYLNFSLVLSSGYIKSICSHLNLTHRPYRIYAIFCVIAI